MKLKVRQRATIGGTILPGTKTEAGRRDVTFGRLALGLLSAWAQTQRRMFERQPKIVFAYLHDAPIPHDQLYHGFWRPLLAAAGIDRPRGERPVPNDTRHFNACERIDAGLNEVDLKDVLGHEDVAFLIKRYGRRFRLSRNRAEQQAAVLEARLELQVP